jgi:predicted DNA-binding transcriptional regulator YafY
MAAMLAKGESLTSKVCQQQFKVSGPAIYADFQTLIRLGIAARVGAGRATHYVLRPQTESLTNH